MSTERSRTRTKVPHRLKRNEKVELFRKIIFVDTETLPISAGNEEKHALRLGVAWYYNLEKSLHESPTARLHFKSAHEFWTWALSFLRKKTKLVIMAHNADFDFAVLEAYRYLGKAGFEFRKFFADSGRFYFQARAKDRTVILLDSMNYFKMSLSELGRHLGIEKMNMPDWSEDDSAWVQYCERDVEILAKSFIRYMRFLKENDLGGIGITISSQAFNAFRHKFMEHEIYVHHFDNVEEAEIQSYYGGRTECFVIGRIKERVYYLDVNSLYPFVMKFNDYPVRYVGTLYDLSPKDLSDLLKRYCVIAHIEVETSLPILPYRTDKTIFPIGRFSGWYCTPELALALEKKAVVRINTAHVYEKARIFSKYVDFFYELKKKAKEQSDKFTYLLAKLYLNSLYGKFGQRNEQLVELKDGEISEEELNEALMSTATGRLTYYKINDQVFLKERREVSFNSFVAIASHVTSYARVHMWRLMEKAGLENVYYMDTDSLFVNQRGFENLKDYIDEYELGKLKLEKVSDNVEILTAKVYRFGEDIKIKGVPRNAHQIDPQTFKYIHFERFKTRLKAGRENEVYAKEVVKKLTLKYDKGLISASGKVIPLEVVERQFSFQPVAPSETPPSYQVASFSALPPSTAQ